MVAVNRTALSRFSRGPHGPMSALLALSLFATSLTTTVVASADERACIDAVEGANPLRKQGKLHDALKMLAACTDSTCPDDVRASCSRKVTEINTAMPTLVLAAKDGSGNDLYNVTASMDGAPLLSSLDGRSVKIDPGEHKFKFETAGQDPVEKTFVIREGEKERREIITIGAPPPPPPPPSAPPPPPSWWTMRRGVAVGVGGVGVVALGLGIVFGALAASDKDKQKQDCAPGACANYGQGVEDYNTASSNATASSVLVISGAALLAGGAVIFFTAPKPGSSASGPSASDPSASRQSSLGSNLRLAPNFSAKSAGLSLGFDL